MRERETATQRLLEVISASRDDERPVFEAIVENAQRLCRAPMSGLILAAPQDAFQRIVAHRNVPEGTVRMFETNQMPVDAETSYAARSIVQGKLIQFEDMGDSDLYRAGSPIVRAMVDAMSIRSVLFVPLMRDGVAIGTITLFRQEVDPFERDHIALVEAFAVQAVIAIENVRQFREVQERLERETATKDILRVISQSRDDEAPVFEAILNAACGLCDADSGSLMLVNAARSHTVLKAMAGKQWGFEIGVSQWPLDLGHAQTEAARSGEVVHEVDLKNSDLYRNGDKTRMKLVDEVGLRTALAVPLFQGDVSIGVIVLHRLDVARAFSDNDIRLVESFAAQAVIAIENVRQFKALEQLNSELERRVQEQVNELERMGKLKHFLPPAVADTVINQGSEAILSSHRSLLGVLFCDIRGFTAFCETAEPEETIEVLQSYHEEMGKLINDHSAGVDHRMGDGIMVLFNDPLPCDDPAGDAVRLAIAMRARMADLCKNWKRMGYRLGFGVGVSLGYATVGMVGVEGRLHYTASGTAVNLASRLCDEAADGEILLSPRAGIAVEDDFAVFSTGEVSLKGIREPVEVFRLEATTTSM